MLDGLTLTPLGIIPTKGGEVLHALKSGDSTFQGFGEAYFSMIESGAIKGWKRHREMIMNLIVPVGRVRFIVRNDRGDTQSFDLGVEPGAIYARLTVDPGLWMAFGGISRSTSIILNIASLPHHPDEADRADLGTMPWSWS